MTKKIVLVTILAIILLTTIGFVSFLVKTTGFLQEKQIDQRDLNKWNYSNGNILGAEEIKLDGNKENCWILLHGYDSTPTEMKELGYRINAELNDTIYVPLLSGHGQVPSKLENKSLEIWYPEVKTIFDKMKNECKNVNLVGSSLSAAITIRLAEEEKINHLYVTDSFLKTNSKGLFLFSNILYYLKKQKVGNINDPEGLKGHIAYMNMPLNPLKESFNFLDQTIKNMNKITQPTIIFHSTNDKTSSSINAELVYNSISSTDKQIIWFNRSNHVVLMDYDKETIIQTIINKEKQTR